MSKCMNRKEKFLHKEELEIEMKNKDKCSVEEFRLETQISSRNENVGVR